MLEYDDFSCESSHFIDSVINSDCLKFRKFLEISYNGNIKAILCKQCEFTGTEETFMLHSCKNNITFIEYLNQT